MSVVHPNPSLIIRPALIRHNTDRIRGWCDRNSIELCAVTKVTCAHPAVVRAFLDAGVTEIGDSRIENLRVIRSLVGPEVHLLLLRLPMISQVEAVIRHTDSCLISEQPTLEALSRAARLVGRRYGVILMVDLGDLREGVWLDRLGDLVRRAVELDGLAVRGVGVNLACFGGVEPTAENMRQFLSLADDVCRAYHVVDPVLSGGNSANLPLLLAGNMPVGINHLRVGESALLGVNVLDRTPIPGLSTDAFQIRAEVVELQRKPSYPLGRSAQNAFGELLQFEDRGVRARAICALGRQDALISGLTPMDEGVEILGGSSDHLILDVEGVPGPLAVGDVLHFKPNYGCLLAAATSPYVTKVVREEDSNA